MLCSISQSIDVLLPKLPRLSLRTTNQFAVAVSTCFEDRSRCCCAGSDLELALRSSSDFLQFLQLHVRRLRVQAISGWHPRADDNLQGLWHLTGLEVLSLAFPMMDNIPRYVHLAGISALARLQDLRISGCGRTLLHLVDAQRPMQLSELKHLQRVRVALNVLWEPLQHLTALEALKHKAKQNLELPSRLCNFSSVTLLDMHVDNVGGNVPALTSLCNLRDLRWTQSWLSPGAMRAFRQFVLGATGLTLLSLSSLNFNNFQCSDFAGMRDLRCLALCSCHAGHTTVPLGRAFPSSLTKLELLDLECMGITALDVPSCLTALKQLHLGSNKLASIPPSLLCLIQLTYLDLAWQNCFMHLDSPIRLDVARWPSLQCLKVAQIHHPDVASNESICKNIRVVQENELSLQAIGRVLYIEY